MKKSTPLVLSAGLVVLAGVALLFIEQVRLNPMKMILPMPLLAFGVLSVVFSISNRAFRIPSQFLLVKGLTFSTDVHQLLMMTTYFIVINGFIEIFFPFAILKSSAKIATLPFLFRLIGGGITVIGTLVLLLNRMTSVEGKTLQPDFGNHCVSPSSKIDPICKS